VVIISVMVRNFVFNLMVPPSSQDENVGCKNVVRKR